MTPEVITAGLCRQYPPDEWELRAEVRLHEDGLRVADFLAVGRSRGPWVAELVEAKDSLHDLKHREPPEKSAPARAISQRWWFAVRSELVRTVRPHIPEGWGLLSCGTGGDPIPILQAPLHEAQEPSPDAVRGLLRARTVSANANGPGLASGRIWMPSGERVKINRPYLAQGRVGLFCGHSEPIPQFKAKDMPDAWPCSGCPDGRPTDLDVALAAVGDVTLEDLERLAAAVERRRRAA